MSSYTQTDRSEVIITPVSSLYCQLSAMLLQWSQFSDLTDRYADVCVWNSGLGILLHLDKSASVSL